MVDKPIKMHCVLVVYMFGIPRYIAAHPSNFPRVAISGKADVSYDSAS